MNVFAIDNSYWSYTKEVSLKKDEFYNAFILEGNRRRKLYFRWTLFINDGLVFMLNYDRFNKQTVLYADYNRDSFKLQLLPKGREFIEEPFLLIQFKKFNKEKKMADFTIFIHDTKGRVVVDDKKSKVF